MVGMQKNRGCLCLLLLAFLVRLFVVASLSVQASDEFPWDRDSDGDGVKDAEEVIAGTDPSSAASVFAVSMSTSADGTLLHWQAFSGRVYKVYSRLERITGGWVLRQVLTNTVTQPLVFTDAQGSNRAFYRLGVELAH